ncbi:MAG: hypothetical protein KIS61_16660 [Candidatus Eremiobacteraeota bacterium]|nr:hypothetical protein [Candidatus Eremiobacteraeota bacterium]
MNGIFDDRENLITLIAVVSVILFVVVHWPPLFRAWFSSEEPGGSEPTPGVNVPDVLTGVMGGAFSAILGSQGLPAFTEGKWILAVFAWAYAVTGALALLTTYIRPEKVENSTKTLGAAFFGIGIAAICGLLGLPMPEERRP